MRNGTETRRENGSENGGSVIVERQAGVGLITLNEPASLNALSGGIKAGLTDALASLLPDPSIRALVVTGAGRAFCAGGDIRAMDERRAPAVRARMEANHRWVRALIATDKPVVTAVNGVAAGAGLSLALMGDIVCAARDARFKAGFPGIGAVPDLAICYTLPRAVGRLRASDLLLTNREIDAEEALAIGLVSRLVSPEELVERALEIAQALAQGPAVSLALTKQLLRRAYELPLESLLEAEALAQATAFGSEDFAEGVAAFRGKRKPSFKGA